MEQQGYLHGGNTHKIAREYRIPRTGIIDFSVNINPFVNMQLITDFLKATLEEIANYPDIDCHGLKAALAQYTDMEDSFILPGNGAIELIYLYLNILGPHKVLIPAPTFSEYALALRQTGVEPDYFRLEEKRHFNYQIGEFLEQIRKGYDLVILCNPNNPTGTILKKDEIKAIVFEAGRQGTRVLLDESFIEFTGNSPSGTAALCKEHKNLFIVRSFTKFFSIPGLRLGYGISCDEELNSAIATGRYPWSINTLAQGAGIFLSRSSSHFTDSLEKMEKEKEFLYKSINQTDWIRAFKPSANFILVKIMNRMTAPELQKHLLEKKILIRDASNFRFLNDKFFRIAVKNRTENQLLIKELMKAGMPFSGT